MIPLSPLGIQREIITSLPEIINDSEQKVNSMKPNTYIRYIYIHTLIIFCKLTITTTSSLQTFIKELVNLMDQNHQLLVPILDALSNFDSNVQMLRQIQESVIDRLESANLEDLPIIIQFLFDTSTSDDINKVILVM